MRLLASLILGSALLMTGCGSGDKSTGTELKDAVTAPVDNIKKNIDTLEDTKSTLKDIATKNNDEMEKILDDRSHPNK